MGEIFAGLVRLAEKRGAIVNVRAWFGPAEQRGHLVLHRRREKDEGVITVRVLSGDVRVIDDVDDAAVLAHEMGHHQAWLNGEEHPDYRRLTDLVPTEGPSVLRPIRDAVMIEESRAWDYARADLQSLGFTAWEAFELQRATMLASYRNGLFP